MSQRANEPTSQRRKVPSPATRLPGAPARPVKTGPAGDEGTVVVAYLREPREQSWGLLLKLDGSGVWLRGIELASFESWIRQVAKGEPGFLGPSTFFVPLHRVEKLVADVPSGPVPSLADRFEKVTGQPARDFLAG